DVIFNAIQPIPAAPASLSVQPSNVYMGGTANLSWSTTQYARHYTIEVVESGEVFTVQEPNRTLSYTALNAGSYTFRVSACSETGCSPVSLSAVLTVVPGVPDTPNPLTVDNAQPLTDEEFTLSWPPVERATSYKIMHNGALFATTDST